MHLICRRGGRLNQSTDIKKEKLVDGAAPFSTPIFCHGRKWKNKNTNYFSTIRPYLITKIDINFSSKLHFNESYSIKITINYIIHSNLNKYYMY